MPDNLRQYIRLRTRLRAAVAWGRRKIQRYESEGRMLLASKKRIFVSSGGMGSSFLIRAIPEQGQTPCIGKPFVNSFFFADYPEKIRALYPHRPVVEDGSAETTLAICESFAVVQKNESNFPHHFQFQPGVPIETNMRNLLGFILEHRYACVLRATSCAELLPSMKAKNVVFLIRHPLQSYISYNKPQRHRLDIEQLGGLEAEEALQFWSWSWCAVADTYLRCEAMGLNPVLLRYEFIQEDLKKAASYHLTRIFANFSYRHNVSRLPEKVENRLRELLGSSYTKIYGDWQLPHDGDNAVR